MLDVETLKGAKEFEVNVSAVAEAALVEAVVEARRKKWLEENAVVFAAQSDWHEHHGHPLAAVILAPFKSS
ncbi:type II toxin-antitoxin system CcdA family antitoxin [Roseovarius sp. THAF27]|uniref:type II toxin-antitoxin system CcdA family antitoxin n=1 Tax=Roseovarius sp. THAF27 TaxID=2587850 RepID=UPI0020C81115|nr:type II toxin-antitoxin system CcdA family antitoxin [Roseovarius sp. THAF27]